MLTQSLRKDNPSELSDQVHVAFVGWSFLQLSHLTGLRWGDMRHIAWALPCFFFFQPTHPAPLPPKNAPEKTTSIRQLAGNTISFFFLFSAVRVSILPSWTVEGRGPLAAPGHVCCTFDPLGACVQSHAGKKAGDEHRKHIQRCVCTHIKWTLMLGCL